MSFCSGLLEGAATYLFADEWYGDAGFNITASQQARDAVGVNEDNQGERRTGNALTNLADSSKWIKLSTLRLMVRRRA